MARASAFVAGVMLGLAIGTAVVVSHADPADADVVEAAAAAHVDPQDLAAAVATVGGTDPWSYLRSTGELPPLPPPPDPPVPPSNARVACLEGKESGGANVANRQGSGAVGVLQFMPSTFYAHAAEMGHFDWSPWNPAQARAVAAHDLALGRRTQWTVKGC